MSEILDRIVKCDISIETPPQDSASFSTIMLIGKKPAQAAENFRTVDKYASLAEVKEAGWKEEDAVYKAARAAFLQEPSPEFIYITAREGAASGGDTEEPAGTGGDAGQEGTPEEGNVPETGDPQEIVSHEDGDEFSAALDLAFDAPGWYGLALAGATEEECEKAARMIETTEKIFCFTAKMNPDTNEIKSPVNKIYLRTFGIFSENENAHIAWLARCFSFTPGSETWAFKTLYGIEPSDLTTRQMSHLEEDNLNYYVTCAGRNITQTGKMVGGEWIDVIRFRDWLKNQMQMQIYELFYHNP